MTSERRIAEILYDELTGKKEGVPFVLRQYEENAALAMVADQTPEIRQLLRDADHLGLEVHPWCGNRWSLAERLAKLIVADDESEPLAVTVNRDLMDPPPPLEPDDSITTYFTTGLVPPAWLERLWRRVRGQQEEPVCAHPGCGKPISDPTHT